MLLLTELGLAEVETFAQRTEKPVGLTTWPRRIWGMPVWRMTV